MCNAFDRLMTACILGLALAAAYVSFDNVARLNDINNAPGRGVASTEFVAQK
jgi:hypothetical protein